MGVFEVDLPQSTFTIGRADEADLTLPDQTVSRVHARIALDQGHCTLEDADSTHGTTVNGKRIQRQVLRHGDSIVIAMYQLEFRTHAELPGAAAAAARAKMLLRGEYCMLPSSAPLRFRILDIAPQDVFASGDTLELGCGGILIPIATPPDDGTCLELHITWPNQTSTDYLGEIQGVIHEESLHWLCVKLHSLPQEKHEATVECAQPGPWAEVLS
jgi:hypothetical protein